MSEQVVLGEEQTQSDEQKLIPESEFVHVKNDMHKWKEKARQADEQLRQYQEKLSAIEDQAAQEQGQFKQLADKYKSMFEAEKQRNDEFKSAWKNDQIMSEIEKAALNKGILPEALADLRSQDFSDVVFEVTDTGRTNVVGANEWVENLKQKKYHWFKDSRPPVVNTNQAGIVNTETKLSPAEILKLQNENPTMYREYMRKTYGI